MRFTVAVWFLTRALVVAAFVATVPGHAVEALGHWDGGWYGAIAQHGYERPAEAAFFPLFPALASLVVRAGITWPLAGVLVNNVAFFLATLAVYAYGKRRFGALTARWTVVLLCALPLSIFGTAAYAEGLFVASSTLALDAYERKNYVLAGCAAAIASATRPLGIALAAALTIGGALERRGAATLGCCAMGFVGIALYALFCASHFGDALAFAHAQAGWRGSAGFNAAGWFGIVRGAMARSPLDVVTLVLVLAGLPCIYAFRKRLGTAGVLYVALCVAILVLAGTPISANRNLYQCVPLLLALGAFAAGRRWIGYGAVAVSLALLVYESVRFAHGLWVA